MSCPSSHSPALRFLILTLRLSGLSLSVPVPVLGPGRLPPKPSSALQSAPSVGSCTTSRPHPVPMQPRSCTSRVLMGTGPRKGETLGGLTQSRVCVSRHCIFTSLLFSAFDQAPGPEPRPAKTSNPTNQVFLFLGTSSRGGIIASHMPHVLGSRAISVPLRELSWLCPNLPFVMCHSVLSTASHICLHVHRVPKIDRPSCKSSFHGCIVHQYHLPAAPPSPMTSNM